MITMCAKPVEEVREISAITYGFMARIAALEFDLFSHIASGTDSLPALAKKTGIGSRCRAGVHPAQPATLTARKSCDLAARYLSPS